MKKLTLSILMAMVLSLVLIVPVMADDIKDGTITDAAGNLITLGYDQFGYNYQAHIFNGIYADCDRVLGGDFDDVNLQMKWNDAWLSNKDLGTQSGSGSFTADTPDGKLDRHYGFDSYIGSGAWLTNHDTGIDAEGKRWTYFVKIIAVSADATLTDGRWYAADGTEIGYEIWGAFAVIQQVVTGTPPSDFITYDGWPIPGNYRSPAGCGLGNL